MQVFHYWADIVIMYGESGDLINCRETEYPVHKSNEFGRQLPSLTIEQAVIATYNVDTSRSIPDDIQRLGKLVNRVFTVVWDRH